MDSEEKRMLLEEMNQIFNEVDSDEKIVGFKTPPYMKELLIGDIRKLEAERARERLCDEDKELLRSALKYKKKYKRQRYLLVAVVVVMVCAMGINSVGGVEKVFETFKVKTMEREQVQINSDEDVVKQEKWSEDEAYEEIEEKFGFYPVKLDYLPEGVEFQEVSMGDEIQGVQMIYGQKEKVDIIYKIRPNYREGSWGKDIEDNLIEEYEIEMPKAVIQIRKYIVENENIRWTALFEYRDVNYSIMFFEMEKEEVEMIIQKLYFSKSV